MIAFSGCYEYLQYKIDSVGFNSTHNEKAREILRDLIKSTLYLKYIGILYKNITYYSKCSIKTLKAKSWNKLTFVLGCNKMKVLRASFSGSERLLIP